MPDKAARQAKSTKSPKIGMKFDESYEKLSKLMKGRLTREKLQEFMKENPDLIVYVPKDRALEAQKRFEESMRSDPIGAQILKAEEEARKQLLSRPKPGKSRAP